LFQGRTDITRTINGQDTFPWAADGQIKTVAGSLINQYRLPVDFPRTYFAVGHGSSAFRLDDIPTLHCFSFIGFQWGTVDRYNSVELLNQNFVPLPVQVGGTVVGTSLSGSLLTNIFGINTDIFPAADIFAGFLATPSDKIGYLRFTSSNNSFEFCNVQYVGALRSSVSATRPARSGAVAVAEPVPGILLAGGLAGLFAAWRTRRR